MIHFILSAAVVAGPASSAVPAQSNPHRGSVRTVQVIGHRGAAGLAPENTLAGFTKAIAIDVDAVELDVQLSADGALVVYHNYYLNPSITRAADGSWVKGKVFIKEASLAALKTYDVGRLKTLSTYALRYPDQQAIDGERIPTLQEAIALFKSSPGAPKTKLWIEIKTSPLTKNRSSAPQAVGDALVDLLRKENITGRVHILSFDWRALYHVQQIAPEIPTVYLSRIGGSIQNIRPGQPGPSPWTAPIDVDDFKGSIPRAIDAAGGENWAAHHRELSASSLAEAHRLGLKVFVWTANDAAKMRRMIQMGVDGIITDRPDILRTVLRSK